MEPAAIEVRELTKVYPTARGPFTAVQDVSFEVRRGEIVGLLGPNGAGKTTVVKCILGLLRPTRGAVRVCGIDVERHRGQALARIGAVLEGNRNVYWRLTALENLVFFGMLHGLGYRQARTRGERLLELLGLQEVGRGKTVGQFSRGMQQKVALGCALIRDPEVLVLDEPTLGLDVEAARDLRHALAEWVRAGGRAALVTSHDMDLVEALCDRVVIIRQGRVVADARVGDLLEAFRMKRYRLAVAGRPEGGIEAELRALLGGDVQIAMQEDGTAIEFVLEDPRMLFRVVDLLRDRGLDLTAVQPLRPSLEEVFLRILREGVPAGG